MRKMIIMIVAYLSMQFNVNASSNNWMSWYGVYNEKGQVEAKFANNLGLNPIFWWIKLLQ